MNVKIGDCVKTLVDKTTYMEDSDYFIVKKGVKGLYAKSTTMAECLLKSKKTMNIRLH